MADDPGCDVDLDRDPGRRYHPLNSASTTLFALAYDESAVFRKRHESCPVSRVAERCRLQSGYHKCPLFAQRQSQHPLPTTTSRCRAGPLSQQLSGAVDGACKACRGRDWTGNFARRGFLSDTIEINYYDSVSFADRTKTVV